MIIDTYDLGNGYRATLLFGSLGIYFVDILKDGKIVYECQKYSTNPFDAIFILMDLGLMGVDVDWCEPREFSYRES